MTRATAARRGMLALLIAATAAALALIAPSPAPAAGVVESFSVSTSTTQAGGHPDLSVDASLTYTGTGEAARDLRLDLPEGLVLLPPSVPRCAAEDFALTKCPPATQVGLATFRGGHEGDGEFLAGTAPVYAIQEPADGFARLGVVIPTLDLPVELAVELRSAADHGAYITAENLPQNFPLATLGLEIWGVPADVTHDLDRFPAGSEGDPAGCPGLADAGCNMGPIASNVSPTPLLVNPTFCGAPLFATLDLRTYEVPDDVASAEAPMAATTGCSLISFNPSSTVTVSTQQTRSPAGLAVDLRVPQTASPITPSPSHLLYADLYFTGGLRLGPAAAGIACTDAEAGLGSESPPACPEQSRVGTVSIEGPFVPDAIEGDVYLGGQIAPGLHGLFLLAEGFGVRFKLVGAIATDSESDELVIFAPELPQLPIERIRLDIPAASGLFVTADHCGEYEVETLFSPWNSELSDQISSQALDLTSSPGGGACPHEPTQARLSLAPPQTVADGASTVTATVAIADEDGLPVPGDDVEFRSTDPGQAIGPTVDNGDGTYSARITTSTRVGRARITAVDGSVRPALTATALLTQGSVPRRPSPPVIKLPATRITKHPPRRTKKRAVTFRFHSTSAGARFRCRLDSRRYRRCASPAKFRRLRPGRHKFSVYAIDRSGKAGRPATYRFRVLKRRSRHRDPRRRPALHRDPSSGPAAPDGRSS